MKHQLPKLPFDLDALHPHISKETMDYHYHKHHKGYVDKLNELIADTPFEAMSLEDTIRNANGPIYNNAAQAWNHTFFWHCLDPNSPYPSGNMKQHLEGAFGTIESFLVEFKAKAMAHFGSGWIWLIDDDSRLTVETTHDGDNWLRTATKPILVCDLWEHAYYLDHRNHRDRFIDTYFKFVNWKFAEKNLDLPLGESTFSDQPHL